jgi:hypothetical protein
VTAHIRVTFAGHDFVVIDGVTRLSRNRIRLQLQPVGRTVLEQPYAGSVLIDGRADQQWTGVTNKNGVLTSIVCHVPPNARTVRIAFTGASIVTEGHWRLHGTLPRR